MTNTNSKLVVADDIFIKAAEDYFRRIGAKPETVELYLFSVREDLGRLADKINALKSVGAI